MKRSSQSTKWMHPIVLASALSLPSVASAQIRLSDDTLPMLISETEPSHSEETTTDTEYFVSAPSYAAMPAAEPTQPAKSEKAKAEELKKKVNGAYKDPFYLNDFSYLKDPNYNDHHIGEGLKQIPVGDQGKLDVGGQYRLRFHCEHNMRGLGLTGRDDNFLLDRTRLFMNYKMNSRIRLYGELLDAGSSYENFASRSIEVQHLDAQNLFADVVLAEDCCGKWTVRGGRQELLLGSQRLISPLDWANTRRNFEGGRLTRSSDTSSTDFLLVRPMNLYTEHFDSPNQNQALWGVYHSDKSCKTFPIDTYYFGFEDTRTNTHVQTLGTALKGENGNLLWDHELGYQFGRNSDGSDISACALTFGAGRKLQGDRKPSLMLYYDWASGDDSVNNGWNHLFPLGHKYLGFMDFYGRRNIHDFNALYTVNATDHFTVLAWYHYFLLSNDNQGPYNVTLTPFNSGGTVGSRDLGHEIDLLGTYKIGPRSDLVLGYSHFFAGDYYSTSVTSANAPLFSRDADFFYTQWHINF